MVRRKFGRSAVKVAFFVEDRKGAKQVVRIFAHMDIVMMTPEEWERGDLPAVGESEVVYG